MLNSKPKTYRVHTQKEEEIVRFLIGNGFGLYESYANDIPVSIKEKCDFEIKTQGAIRVAYGKEYLADNQEFGQDVARSIGGVLHYHESSFEGVTHWTPNVYYRADHHSYIAQSYLRNVKTLCFDIDQKMSVNQILHAFDFMGLDVLPSLILKTPKGVQFFISLDELWRGQHGISYAKSIANALKAKIGEVLPIDMGKDVFGWARFPREEVVMYFEPSNTWDSQDAKSWHSENGITHFKSGKTQYKNQAWYSILKESAEKGNRNFIIQQLAIVNALEGVSEEDTIQEIFEWNQTISEPEKRNRVIDPIKNIFRRSSNSLSVKRIEEMTGEKVRINGWYKHKKNRKERTYDHLNETVSDLNKYIVSRFEKTLPGEEGGVMSLEVSSRKLSHDMYDGEIKKNKSITRALETFHKANRDFVVRKKLDPKGRPLKGRGAGYIIYRTRDLINMILEAKKASKELDPKLTYRAATFAEKHQENYLNSAKKKMCQLPIKLVPVPCRLVKTMYLDMLSVP